MTGGGVMQLLRIYKFVQILACFYIKLTNHE